MGFTASDFWQQCMYKISAIVSENNLSKWQLTLHLFIVLLIALNTVCVKNKFDEKISIFIKLIIRLKNMTLLYWYLLNRN